MRKKIEDSSVDSQVETIPHGKEILEYAQEPINKRWLEAISRAPKEVFSDSRTARAIMYPKLSHDVQELVPQFHILTNVLLDLLRFERIIGEKRMARIISPPEISREFITHNFKGKSGLRISSQYEFIAGQFPGIHRYFIDFYPTYGLVRTGHDLSLRIRDKELGIYVSVENCLLKDYAVLRESGLRPEIVCRPRGGCLFASLKSFPISKILERINSVGPDGQ